jgi:hypothetical protein
VAASRVCGELRPQGRREKESRVIAAMKNWAPSSCASVEEKAFRGSRLTFLLAAKLEVAPGGVRRAIMNYRLRLLRTCSTLAAASTCNFTAAKGQKEGQ